MFNAIHFLLLFFFGHFLNPLTPPLVLRLLADDILRTKKKAKLQTMTNEHIFINRATQTPHPQLVRKKPTTTTTTKSTASALLNLQASGKRSMESQVSKVVSKAATIKAQQQSPQSAHSQHFGPHNHDHWLCQQCCSGPDCRRSFSKNRKKRNHFQPNRNHKPNSPKAL